MNPLAYLSDFDRDCFSLAIDELERKYPGYTRAELEQCKEVISEQMSELGKKRFLKWMSSRAWSDYTVKKKP